jgi:hypothetical protein
MFLLSLPERRLPGNASTRGKIRDEDPAAGGPQPDSRQAFPYARKLRYSY